MQIIYPFYIQECGSGELFHCRNFGKISKRILIQPSFWKLLKKNTFLICKYTVSDDDHACTYAVIDIDDDYTI